MKKQPTSLRVREVNLLGDFLEQKMGGMTRTSIKNMLSRRIVQVNGAIQTRMDMQVNPGDEVVIQPGRGNQTLVHPKLRIVYEDDYLIVVEKKCGLLTVAAHPGATETTAFSILLDYVRRENRRNGIFVVHRLDRETSGLLVFSKKQDLQEYMRTYWRQIVTNRTYVAVANGIVKKDESTIRSWLTEDPRSTMVYSSPTDNGGKYAVTHFYVLNRTTEHSLVEYQLETGRKNQIRVHSADMGHPVCGDVKYGNGDDPLGRLCLHAYVLCFYHPVTHERMEFETMIPTQFRKLFK